MASLRASSPPGGSSNRLGSAPSFPWHARSADDALRRLASGADGPSEAEAARRPPLAPLLHVAPPGGREWRVIVPLALLPAVLGQAAAEMRARRGAP